MHFGIYRISWRMNDSLMDHKIRDFIYYKIGGLRSKEGERMFKVTNNGMFLK